MLKAKKMVFKPKPIKGLTSSKRAPRQSEMNPSEYALLSAPKIKRVRPSETPFSGTHENNFDLDE